MNWSLIKALKHGTLYRQLSAGVLVIMIIMMFASSWNLNTYTINKLTKLDENMALQTMHQTGDQLKQIMNGLYSAMNLLIFDNQIRDIAQSSHYRMTYEYYVQLKAVRSRLTTFINSYSYIESIYIYINSSTIIGSTLSNAVSPIPANSVPILNTAFYKKMLKEPFHSFWSYGNSEPAFYFYQNNSYVKPKKNLITIGCSHQELGKNSQFTVMISINPECLNILLSSTLVDNNPNYLINDEDRIIATTSDIKLGEKLPFDIPNNADKVPGKFLTEMDGDSVQVVYSYTDYPSWRIVKIIPVASNIQQAGEINYVFLLTFLLSITISMLLIRLWLRRCLHPMAVICDKMTEVSKGNFGVRIELKPKNEFGNVINNFNAMSENLADLYEERIDSANKLRELEIKALRAQMNPHFIYNTLNMVKWMALVQNAHNIEECVVALAEMLRPIFRSDTELTTMNDEIAYLASYIKILSYRFGNLVDLSMDMDDDSKDALVPRFIIQPIIENCIYHGRYSDDRLLRISIRIAVENQDMTVTVQDNGKGISQEMLVRIRTKLYHEDETEFSDDGQVGLCNVHRRIQLHYGKQYGLKIDSCINGGTIVTIRTQYTRKTDL